MQAKKIKNFIVQLILTPVSLIINLIAIAPIYALISGDFGGIDPINYIFAIPILYAISFGLQRLLFRIKGKHIDDTYEVFYKGLRVKDVDTTYYGVTLNIEEYTYSQYETHLNALGWIATILSFIAFPLRLISLLISFIALFVPPLYSTFKKVGNGAPLGKFAAFTHTFFDFVVVPVKRYREGKVSPKGLIYIVVYIASAIILNVCLLTVYSQIPNHIPESINLIFVFVAAFFILTDLIMLVKYCIVICIDYSKKIAVKRLIKLISLPIIMIILYLILCAIPFA